MIARPELLGQIRSALKRSPVVALLGPRQSGKTTLARMLLAADSENYFDLEDPASLRRLDNPETALSELRGLIVIDEVQRRPELFSVLRVLADRPRKPACFLLLGSASPALLRQSSESLSGRIETIHTVGLSAQEVGHERLDRLWLRGGFPRSFLAASEADSSAWRRNFIQTFLERDIPQLGIKIPAPQLERFWTILAHYHGQLWNAAEPASSLGLSQPTVRGYLDLMTSTYMIRQLQPWHENLAKRQVKAPKIYVRDSGLLHGLLGLRTKNDLRHHPKLGASWEGFVVEQILKTFAVDHSYFWATHQGAELDLLLMRGSRRVGIEIKYADAPALTPSMRFALQNLNLNQLWVVYPGKRRYSLLARIEALPFDTMVKMNGRDLFSPQRQRRKVA
jgi:predicted AAA+ superfamily ATPase